MSKENIEFVDSKKERDELKGRSIRDIFNGTLLTRGIILKNIGFIIWLTFLGIVYIGNSYHAERVARDISKLQREVKDLRAESITTAAELMYVSRQSVVQRRVQNSRLEVKESVEPPYKIKN
jgi:hypothetical protein